MFKTFKTAARRVGTALAAMIVASVVAVTLGAHPAASANSHWQHCEGSKWVRSVTWTFYDGWAKIDVEPSGLARHAGRWNNASVWRDINLCVPVPVRTYPVGDLGTRQGNSAYDQLWCHTYYSYRGTSWFGGSHWNLETYREPFPSMRTMFNTRCNW